MPFGERFGWIAPLMKSEVVISYDMEVFQTMLHDIKEAKEETGDWIPTRSAQWFVGATVNPLDPSARKLANDTVSWVSYESFICYYRSGSSNGVPAEMIAGSRWPGFPCFFKRYAGLYTQPSFTIVKHHSSSFTINHHQLYYCCLSFSMINHLIPCY